MNIFSRAARISHKLDLENPFSVTCANLPKTISPVHPDMHYDLQIGIVLSGALEVSYPDFKTKLCPGQFWWSSCWEPHVCRVMDDDTTHLVISCIPDVLGNADPFGQFRWLSPFSPVPSHRPQATTQAAKKRALSMGRALRNIYEERPFGWRTLLWLKIHELILLLSQEKTTPQNRKQVSAQSISRVLPALQLVKSDLSKPVFLESAARACHMSVSRFSEVFRDIMGITFGTFALRARICGAAQVLKTTNQPLKAIAKEWGFANSSHFHHVFKRHFRRTPAQYRRLSTT